MAGSQKGSDARRAAQNEAARVMGVGLQFAASIVVFLLAGQWLDRKLGTDPWLLLLGVMVGAGAGFYSMYRQLTRGGKDDGKPGR